MVKKNKQKLVQVVSTYHLLTLGRAGQYQEGLYFYIHVEVNEE